ncbi:nucleotidyltransferase domain-containing protein [Arcobacter cloacae]|uniref:nucleotidyltransferase domain-containing protein n=1 Tax=Arcobacter cloacae TaxID=1054034 RepID=UPI001E424D7D|nr:nucleotidyltransferase family protein [Arcobacter cloacae]
MEDWDSFIPLAYSHGIFPLVYRSLKEFQQLIPDDIFIRMKQHYMDIVKQNMLMTSELIKVVKILEENNIESISFKGPVLSQLAYGDVVSRQYCDLDILVDENELKKAQNILENNNYKQLYNLEEYQKENLKKVVHDISMINKINNINIELHWTLSSGEFFIDLEKLKYFEDIKKYTISNQNINIFLNEKLFIYLCVHGYKHLWERIEWLVDIYYLIEKKSIDIEKVIEMSKSINAERIVLSTLIICKKIFDLEIILEKDILNDKKLNRVTNKMLEKIFEDYLVLKEKNHTKQFSIIHLYMLKTTANKLKYFKTFLLPTEHDYEKVRISSNFHFLYYLLRPFNILKRILFKS